MSSDAQLSQKVDELLDRCKNVLGTAAFNELVVAHRSGTAGHPHRIVRQLLLLDDARNGALSPVREDAALVSLPEVDSVLTFAEEGMAHSSAAIWQEIRRGLASSAEYLPTVGVIQVASLLRVHHPTTDFVATSSAERQPDLLLSVADALPLAVEVKAPATLWQQTTGLDLAHGRRMVRNALASAGTVTGQLRADRPGVLALTGLMLSQETYDTVVVSIEHHLAIEGSKTPHLLGLAISNLRNRVEAAAGRVSPLLEQQSVLRRNPFFRGPLHIDDDWAGPWRLVARATA